MSTYTEEQIQRIMQTEPEKITSQINQTRKFETNFRERARAALDARKTPAPASGYHKFLHNYGQKYIKTGSSAPIVHMMLILGVTGIGIEYLCHHRPAQQAKAAAENHH